MKIRVLTPTQDIFDSNEVEEVVAPGVEGEFGVLPEHENLLATLDIGKVDIKLTNNSLKTILIKGGILEVSNNKIIILVDEGDLPESIVERDIDLAIKNAEEKIASNLPPAELIRLEKELRYQRFKKNFVQF